MQGRSSCNYHKEGLYLVNNNSIWNYYLKLMQNDNEMRNFRGNLISDF